MSRLNTKLESEGAEFLVLGQLLLERIPAFKTYTNMPGYDLVATHADRNRSARIQVKSRWRTGAPGFVIRNFDCEFIVFCRLNRGNKAGTVAPKTPEFFIFPKPVVQQAWREDSSWGKVFFREIVGADKYRDRWDIIWHYLETGRMRRLRG